MCLHVGSDSCQTYMYMDSCQTHMYIALVSAIEPGAKPTACPPPCATLTLCKPTRGKACMLVERFADALRMS